MSTSASATGIAETPATDIQQLLNPGVWKVDPGHADIGFVGRHFMLTKVRGRFTGVDATVTVTERIQDSTIVATIDMASVVTGDPTRDDHLRSADLLDTTNWPTATFRSTSISLDGNRGTMTGELTIKGTTRPVALDVEFLGALRDPWGNDRAVFEAHGKLNREAWGLTWNMALEAGGVLVSKEIALEFHLELIRDA